MPPVFNTRMDAIDGALRIVEVLEDLDREHRVEGLAAPFELVQVAADVRLFRGIDVEPHIPLGPYVCRVRRRLGANIQNGARPQAPELRPQLAIESQSIDRADFQRRYAGPQRCAQGSKHA